jgi:sugar lactone lactonase YvrE
MRHLLLLVCSVFFGTLFYALLFNPVTPAAWTPPEAPAMTGVLAPNDLLAQSEMLGAGKMLGPEDVDVDSLGNIYGGLKDGRISRITADGRFEDFAHTQGRPLGLHFDVAGNLIVADAMKGLLMVEPDATITALVTEIEGKPLKFADDVVTSSDDMIYFTDASSQWDINNFRSDVVEMRPYGSLIRYTPATGDTEVLLDNLYFANGVALSSNEEFVVVAETSTYRIVRYWLKGPKAGQMDYLVENLPGFPDGISSGLNPVTGEALFWVAIPALRNKVLDATHPYPWLKKILIKLPEFLQPQPKHYGLVLALDEQGNILKSLHDPEGLTVYDITSVQQVGEWLYFGSLTNDHIGRLPVTQALSVR